MFENLVVPVDLSRASLEAVPIATALAATVGGSVRVVTVVDETEDEVLVGHTLDKAIEGLGPQPADVDAIVLVDRSVSAAVSRFIEQDPGSMVLLRSHGHGRSAAILGTTVDELLRAMFGPLIVIGPNASDDGGALDGTYVVPLDGSELAAGVMPIVAAWAVEFTGSPCLVEVVDERAHSSSDVAESSYVRAQASDLGHRIGRPVDFEVLHGSDAAGPIVDYAATRNASLIFLATHGRTGLERLRSGSVAADVVRHARVPVVMFRPPSFVRHDPATDRGEPT